MISFKLRFKGGPGSGDFGHKGRPGQVGGSSTGVYGGHASFTDMQKAIVTETMSKLPKTVTSKLSNVKGNNLAEIWDSFNESDWNVIMSYVDSNKEQLDDDYYMWRDAYTKRVHPLYGLRSKLRKKLSTSDSIDRR